MTRVVYERRARQTGTVVQIVDRGLDDFERAEAAEQGYEWLRWETVCVDHGGVCSHPTRALAKAFAPLPREWCPTCQELDRDAVCKCGGEFAFDRDTSETRCVRCGADIDEGGTA